MRQRSETIYASSDLGHGHPAGELSSSRAWRMVRRPSDMVGILLFRPHDWSSSSRRTNMRKNSSSCAPKRILANPMGRFSSKVRHEAAEAETLMLSSICSSRYQRPPRLASTISSHGDNMHAQQRHSLRHHAGVPARSRVPYRPGIRAVSACLHRAE